jgi:hypothetical protein
VIKQIHTAFSALIVLFALLTHLSGVCFAQAAAIPEWNGEYFGKKQGGLYVKTVADGFTRPAMGHVHVTLYGIIQQQFFTFANSQVAKDGAVRQIWKLPAGKYQITRVDFTDDVGIRRTWTGRSDRPLTILVPRLMIANLGLWTLSASGPTGLNIKFEMVPNTYREAGPRGDSSVAAVINGFTGTIQQMIGGKRTIDAAEEQYSNKNSLRATASYTRQIGMFYKVNLFRHNRFAKDFLAAISAFDPSLRRCYVSTLERAPALKGDLVFQILSSGKTGSIRQATKSKGSITDGVMIDCILTELKQIPMPVRENMLGELTFMFETK